MSKKQLSEYKESTVYFSEDTERAIIEYNLSTDTHHRNVIFNSHIHYPLQQIVENIYNRYFSKNYMNRSAEELKQDALAYLVDKLDRYTEEKGKAFSYFSVIVRNYFIQENKKAYKELKQDFRIDSLDNFDLEDPEFAREEETPDINPNIILREMCLFWKENINHQFHTERERKIAWAIVSLVDQYQRIDNFNKKALLIYIREMTGEKTNNITLVMNTLKNKYLLHKQEITETYA